MCTQKVRRNHEWDEENNGGYKNLHWTSIDKNYGGWD